MKVLVTGSEGFLGWHTRVRLHAGSNHQVVAVDRDEWPRLPDLVRGVDAVVHIAGVNRGTDQEVERGNIELATAVASATRVAGSAPRIVYANSVQSGTQNPYGRGKARAAEILAAAARDLGATFVDVHLPNLFGEHGRPHYNSFVATFAHAVVAAGPVDIVDRAVDLLHAQGAAQALIDALTGDAERVDPRGTPTTVQAVYDTLCDFNAIYAAGDVPALESDLDVQLFNTLRAAQFPTRYPIPLRPRTDARGDLVEVVRTHGGPGQTFVSTTKPGITRGEHFHLRKMERFVVLSGTARISLRRALTDSVVSFDVNGEAPAVIDMPTMWAHNITNTGSGELTTLFWTNELFNPADPDTFPEVVGL